MCVSIIYNPSNMHMVTYKNLQNLHRSFNVIGNGNPMALLSHVEYIPLSIVSC